MDAPSAYSGLSAERTWCLLANIQRLQDTRFMEENE